MAIKTRPSSALKSVSASPSSALIGSSVPTGVQTAISGSPFRRNPFPLGGSYALKAGTPKADTISITGLTAVFAGPGDDKLTGLSRLSADRQWTLFPFLSGGHGNDRYTINKGHSAIIADMNGGDDTVLINGLNVGSIRYAIVDKNDLMITDGVMCVLLLDPKSESVEKGVNKLETVVINGVAKSIDLFYEQATNSFSFLGSYSYPNLHRVGLFNYTDLVSEPSQMTDLVKGNLALNNLMIF